MEDRYLDDDREYGAICSRCGASVENWEVEYVSNGKGNTELVLCPDCYDELIQARNEVEQEFLSKCAYVLK